MSSIRAAWRNIPPAIRAGLTTGWVTFAGTALIAVIGLLDAVRGWAETGGDPPDFSQWTRLVAAAAAALASAVVNTLYRFIRPPAVSYPDAELGRDMIDNMRAVHGGGR